MRVVGVDATIKYWDHPCLIEQEPIWPSWGRSVLQWTHLINYSESDPERRMFCVDCGVDVRKLVYHGVEGIA